MAGRLMCCAIVLCAAGSLRAEEARAPRMARTLESSESWYYQLSLQDKPFGLGKLTLVPMTVSSGAEVQIDLPGVKKSHKTETTQTYYVMTANLSATAPTGQHVTGEVDARITSAFAPEQVKLKRTVAGPDGKVMLVAELTADITSSGIEATMVTNGKESKQTLPLPNVPMVFGVEAYVELCALDSLDGAVIHEFSPQSATPLELHAKVTPKDDGTEVQLTRTDGVPAYVIELDKAGRLTRWSEGPNAPSAVRITKEAYEKLEAEEKTNDE
ncbi:MAG: hypothetical protein H6816_10935 [Phycisphaerales bacterium]|nr:hypothetical protein [Phycisphaerales bacterium]